jgi:hypothetical protein
MPKHEEQQSSLKSLAMAAQAMPSISQLLTRTVPAPNALCEQLSKKQNSKEALSIT